MKKESYVSIPAGNRTCAGVGTQIHAQDTAYLCGGYHSHMHSAADGCLRTLKEQQAARDAAANVRLKQHRDRRRRHGNRMRQQHLLPTPRYSRKQ